MLSKESMVGRLCRLHNEFLRNVLKHVPARGLLKVFFDVQISGVLLLLFAIVIGREIVFIALHHCSVATFVYNTVIDK